MISGAGFGVDGLNYTVILFPSSVIAHFLNLDVSLLSDHSP